MSFRSASEIHRDVYGAYWNLVAHMEENSECTRHMLEGVAQILDQIYWLPIESDDEGETILIDVAQESVYGRLQRIHRWIVQWPQRSPIDEALSIFEATFWANYTWLHTLQGPVLQTALHQYLQHGEDLWDFDEDTYSDSESSTNTSHNQSPSSVETPPPPNEALRRRNNP
jgi:hypothetical protein